MSLIRVDHFQPQFVKGQALSNGQTFISNTTLLNGAVSVAIQFVLSQGAAATCYAEATNYDTADKNAVWFPCQSFTLDANNQGAMIFSAVDQLTGMHAMRLRIVPTADGQLDAAVNLRHYSH